MAINRQCLALGVVSGVLVYGAAYGQTGVTAPSMPTTPASAATPFANPMMNPFMNPYMTQNNYDRTSTLLYLQAANQANGGLGSGRISGTRPFPKTPAERLEDRKRRAWTQSGHPEPLTQRPSGRRPAEMPRSMSNPGGAANAYFQRGPVAQADGRPYFDRHHRYFNQNGR